jgi:hypothetical protein
MLPPRETIPYPATVGQVLPDSIELCCPVCGYSNFSQNKTGLVVQKTIFVNKKMTQL